MSMKKGIITVWYPKKKQADPEDRTHMRDLTWIYRVYAPIFLFHLQFSYNTHLQKKDSVQY